MPEIYNSTKVSLGNKQTERSSVKMILRPQLKQSYLNVNSRVPKTMRHGTSLHRICPKLLIYSSLIRLESIDSSPSRLEPQTSVRRLTAKLFGSSPIRLESQVSVRRPTLKLIGSSHSRLESSSSVRRPSLNPFGSSPRRLSFNRRRTGWLTSWPYVPRPSQPLTTHALDVSHLPVTETKMSPIVCTLKTRIATISSLSY